MIATIVPTAVTVMAHPDPSRSASTAIRVSHGVRNRATCWRKAVSARSATRRTEVKASVAGTQTKRTTSRTNQSLPVVPMLRGSGGGAPVGRRRRRAPIAGAGEAEGMTAPAAASCGASTTTSSVTGRPRAAAIERRRRPASACPR